jgi:hypothetical protein
MEADRWEGSGKMRGKGKKRGGEKRLKLVTP